MRYLYSVIRFVPFPERAEFINIGLIVGSDERHQWRLHRVADTARARQLDEHHVFTSVISHVNDLEWQLGEPLARREEWLTLLYEHSRNLVQFSVPTPIAADSLDYAIQSVLVPLFWTNGRLDENGRILYDWDGYEPKQPEQLWP